MITNIHRRTKKEAEQAISDLVKRGFTVVYPLTEKKDNLTSSGSYNYRRGKYESISMSISSCWFAKLEKVDKP